MLRFDLCLFSANVAVILFANALCTRSNRRKNDAVTARWSNCRAPARRTCTTHWGLRTTCARRAVAKSNDVRRDVSVRPDAPPCDHAALITHVIIKHLPPYKITRKSRNPTERHETPRNDMERLHQWTSKEYWDFLHGRHDLLSVRCTHLSLR